MTLQDLCANTAFWGGIVGGAYVASSVWGYGLAASIGIGVGIGVVAVIVVLVVFALLR